MVRAFRGIDVGPPAQLLRSAARAACSAPIARVASPEAAMSAVPREDTMATMKPNAPATYAAPAGKMAPAAGMAPAAAQAPAAPAKAPAKKK